MSVASQYFAERMLKPRRRYDCKVPQIRVSASFAPAEVEALAWVSLGVLPEMKKSRDERVLEMVSAVELIARKTKSMRATIEAKAEERQVVERELPRHSGFSLVQAAKELGIASSHTVHRWMREGRIAAVCHGRYGYRVHPEALAQFRTEHAEVLKRAQRIKARKPSKRRERSL